MIKHATGLHKNIKFGVLMGLGHPGSTAHYSIGTSDLQQAGRNARNLRTFLKGQISFSNDEYDNEIGLFP